MIREASGIEPKVYARYEFGREKMADLKGKILHWNKCSMCVANYSKGLNDQAIEDKVSALVKDGQ